MGNRRLARHGSMPKNWCNVVARAEAATRAEAAAGAEKTDDDEAALALLRDGDVLTPKQADDALDALKKKYISSPASSTTTLTDYTRDFLKTRVEPCTPLEWVMMNARNRHLASRDGTIPGNW